MGGNEKVSGSGLDFNHVVRRRFALTGRSYGGYMCYAAAVQFAEKLKSTHCVVAISNFVTFLETTQSYRRDLRRAEYGDERDPKQRAKLLAISPLERVKEMKKPMFTVTGGNDPRVPASEAEQVVKAIRANLAAMGATGDVRQSPVASIGGSPRTHHLVFLDPPYGLGLADPALSHLHERGWIAPGALVSVETAAADPLTCDWERVVERRFGKALVRLLRAPA